MEDVKKLARDWQVSERWVRATLDEMAVEARDLRELGKDAAEICSPLPIECRTRSIWDPPKWPDW